MDGFFGDNSPVGFAKVSYAEFFVGGAALVEPVFHRLEHFLLFFV